MTIQEIYLRKYPIFNITFEELTQKDIDDVCNSVHYHAFALDFHINKLKDLAINRFYELGSSIRRGLRN